MEEKMKHRLVSLLFFISYRSVKLLFLAAASSTVPDPALFSSEPHTITLLPVICAVCVCVSRAGSELWSPTGETNVLGRG